MQVKLYFQLNLPTSNLFTSSIQNQHLQHPLMDLYLSSLTDLDVLELKKTVYVLSIFKLNIDNLL